MKYRGITLGLVLAAANLVLAAGFLVLREPVPPDYQEIKRTDTSSGTALEISSGDPHLFAGRLLYWHYGEGLPIRAFALINLPAVFATWAISTVALPLTISISDVSRSWLTASFFALACTAQWVLIGWVAASAARRWSRKRAVV